MGDVPPRRIPVRRKHLIRLSVALWAALALFIVYGTLLPFRFVTDRAFVYDKLARVTLNPFISPDTGRRVSIPDVAQNVLLFLPFGFIGVLALRGRRAGRAGTIATVTALAATFSVLLETLQLFTVDRTTSFADLVACTTGALAGALACDPVDDRWRRSRTAARVRGIMELPAFYPFIAASLLVWAAAWNPFDVTLDVSTVVGKLHALRADPWQPGALGEELVAAVRYAAFGLTLALWMRQAGIRASASLAAMGGSAAAVALEMSQGLIASRMPGMEAAAAHVAATLAGAVLSPAWPYGRSPLFWWALWMALTAVGASLELRVPVGDDPLTILTRTFEIVLLIAPVVYGGYLARRRADAYAWR